MLGNSGAVRRIGAHVQNAAVHPRMQRLHPAIEHFGKAGERGNVFHLDAAFPQQFGGAAGGDQFHLHRRQPPSKLHHAGLIGDA